MLRLLSSDPDLVPFLLLHEYYSTIFYLFEQVFFENKSFIFFILILTIKYYFYFYQKFIFFDKNMNKSNILKNIDMKGIEQMKNLYNETVKNYNIEQVEEMANQQKALQMIKDETIEGTIKYEVIEWVQSMMDGYDNIEDIFNDLFTGGCESGIVTELIYYEDTLNFYNKHKYEIEIFIDECLDIEEVETLEGIQELVRYFPDLEDEDTRIFDGQDRIIDKAMDDLKDDYNLDEFSTEEIEQMEDDYIRSESEATNLFELNNQDKNMLAWASFENEASLLYDEYLDVLNELYMEEL